jgi:hypothetical protein
MELKDRGMTGTKTPHKTIPSDSNRPAPVLTDILFSANVPDCPESYILYQFYELEMQGST